MKRFAVGLVLVLLLTACGGGTTTQVSSAPVPRNDDGMVQNTIPTPAPVAPGADGNYQGGYALPAVTTVYSLTIEVLAAPGSIQNYAFQGESHAVSYDGYGSASGYIAGGTSGKGFVRAKVLAITWHDPYVDKGVTARSESWTPLAAKDDIVLLKTTDTKASALGAGDVVTVLCREQYEWVDAVAGNEIPTTQTVTREFDYCRMTGPQFTPAPIPAQ